MQGVGFRPFIFRIASERALTGYVVNDTDGVRIHAEGDMDSLAAFATELVACAPQASNIDSVEITDATLHGYSAFVIEASDDEAPVSASISPDIAVCDSCLREMLDETGRRAGYPYVNCASCGPRFS
ncbi:MAG: acylphosphatase, partial [Gemmatimonadota bacterium]|nr:acylphosphatase [Gemmatimonadota bacterium]